MCGLCGIWRPSGPIDVAQLERMTDVVAHRGPDGRGVFVGDGIGLGFRRLAIIDLEGGAQPMSDESGDTWVVSNGEIYNFAELRVELERLGHRFRTRSDTEVLVHGYRAWGDRVLQRLNGMFGLAVWDSRRSRLLLARDRAGVKPLYWARDGDRLLFGSEIRSILAARSHRPGLDAGALSLFLQLRYVPSPWTLYQGIHRLPAGTCLVADRTGIRTTRWWDFRPAPVDPPPTPQAAARELERRYDTAVRRQLVSDVPVGLLLSGGLDSGLLLALMSRRDRGWRTFSVGYGADDRHDELGAAASTARRFGATHTEVVLDRSTFEAALPRVVRTLEEPVASPSVVGMDEVCRRAAADVTVALMGQGPDELLGGYRRHLGVRYGEVWRLLPRPVHRVAGRGVATAGRMEGLQRAAHALAETDPVERWRRTLSIATRSRVEGLFRGDLVGREPPLDGEWSSLAQLAGTAGELNGFQFLEISSSLPDELLLYADKLSMAHGLEVRVPYLDHEVIEYALGLPARLKVRGARSKWIHRQVCAGALDAATLRRPKRGFAVGVVDGWYRESVNGLVEDTLLEPASSLYGVLDPGPVTRLVHAHRAGRADHHKLIHALVVAELWMRELGLPGDPGLRRSA